jgi:uncharacterized protein YceH (UPF0502 family)
VDPDAVELRVLGCLIEKQRTTPDQYPLTLNSLRLACNQATNRNPVVDYDEATVREALTRLHRRGWARLTSTQGSRAPKFRHLFDEALGLAPDEMTVLAVLMLRGPQTPGELKSRTDRMHGFADLAGVHVTLDGLIARELVARLDRRPGQKEERYVQLIGGDEDEAPAFAAAPVPAPAERPPVVERPAVEEPPPAAPPPPPPPPPPPTPPGPSSAELARDVQKLRDEVAFLRTELDDLRRDLGA